jgi:hypothetical protein
MERQSNQKGQPCARPCRFFFSFCVWESPLWSAAYWGRLFVEKEPVQRVRMELTQSVKNVKIVCPAFVKTGARGGHLDKVGSKSEGVGVQTWYTQERICAQNPQLGLERATCGAFPLFTERTFNTSSREKSAYFREDEDIGICTAR